MYTEIGREPFTRETEHKSVGIDIDKNPEGLPKGVWLLMVDLGDTQREIPVFNCREDSHHEYIASEFADYKTGVVFGVGLYGIAGLVEHPLVGEHPNSDKAFFKAKSNRSIHDKIPIYLPPKHLPTIMDMDKVHPEFRQYLYTREKRELLWEKAGAIHLIVPTKDAPHIHDIFVTTPETWKAKNAPLDQHMPVPTASVFWWHDPDWENITDIIETMRPDAIAGISSFNEHREQPAWNFEGVVKFINDKRIVPFDFVVRDPVGESLTVKSSHTQIAVALKGQEAIWKVYRTGARSPQEFLRRIGSTHNFRLVDGHRIASREDPPDAILDDKTDTVQDASLKNHLLRHPKPRGVLERLRLIAT